MAKKLVILLQKVAKLRIIKFNKKDYHAIFILFFGPWGSMKQFDKPFFGLKFYDRNIFIIPSIGQQFLCNHKNYL